MSTQTEQPWVDRLLDVGRTLITELDEEAVLRRVLDVAREATRARYAAIGILDEERFGLDRFIAVGIDEKTRAAIGENPRGRGVLGELIEDPQPLRLADVGEHPKSFGFPPGHPVMRTFLGVPIVIRERIWGNLYLTEKRGGFDFTDEDERAAVVLADWAAVAIANARLYETSDRRRQELEKAVRGLQASRDVAIAIGSDLSLEHALGLIAERGRTLVDARSLVIMLREGPELVVSAGDGAVEDLRGMRIPIAESTSGDVLERRAPERIEDLTRLRIAPRREFGVPDPRTALLVPLLYRGESVGVLAAFDRGAAGHGFTEDDEQLLYGFAASAATAVALAQNARSERLRSALGAADTERRRWGRELHDETLQGLSGIRLLLSSALRSGNPDQVANAATEAVGHVEREIKNLRSIIAELRPAALDELGLPAAIEALVEHQAETSGLRIGAEVHLEDRRAGDRLDSELEAGIYRLIQEALTNVVKHAHASSVQIAVQEHDSLIAVELRDDGVGFDPAVVGTGFGLLGMRERVRIAGGTLEISSGPEGTLVHARLPKKRRIAPHG
jgi:two-component system, NarL family, sensor histidine kinase DevS